MMRRSKKYVSWAAATALVACSLYPWTAKRMATRQTTRRLDEVERVLRLRGDNTNRARPQDRERNLLVADLRIGGITTQIKLIAFDLEL